MKDQAIEATIASAAQKAALTGSGAAVWGGWTANDIAAFGGLAVAIIGVAIQWYYKIKADRREAQLHALRLNELQDGDP